MSKDNQLSQICLALIIESSEKKQLICVIWNQTQVKKKHSMEQSFHMHESILHTMHRIYKRLTHTGGVFDYE